MGSRPPVLKWAPASQRRNDEAKCRTAVATEEGNDTLLTSRADKLSFNSLLHAKHSPSEANGKLTLVIWVKTKIMEKFRAHTQIPINQCFTLGTSYAWWHTPIIPAIWKAEADTWLSSRQPRPCLKIKIIKKRQQTTAPSPYILTHTNQSWSWTFKQPMGRGCSLVAEC